jgi:hypothetical protein
MKLLEVITAAGGRVSGGDSYLWKCFGDNAQFMEFCDVDGHGYSHCIFDTKTYEVYQIHIEVPLVSNEADSPEQTFLWTADSNKKAYYTECEKHNVDPNSAWDDVNYTHVDTEELILSYVKDIGETYYDDLPLIGTGRVMDMPGTIGSAKIVFPEENNR